MIIGTISFVISVLLFGTNLIVTLNSELKMPILAIAIPTAIVALGLCRFSIRKLDNASTEVSQTIKSYSFWKNATISVLMIALIYVAAIVTAVFIAILTQVNIREEKWYESLMLLFAIFACVLVPLFYLLRKMRNMRKAMKALQKIRSVNTCVVNTTLQYNSTHRSIQEYKMPSECSSEFTRIDPALLEPYDYEQYVAAYLLKHGYKSATVTQKSGDYGVDIVAVNAEGWRVAIQCKRYQGSVGVSAIQEIVTGKEYQGCDLAAVYTTGSYTQQAVNLAKKVHVKLYVMDKEGLRAAN